MATNSSMSHEVGSQPLSCSPHIKKAANRPKPKAIMSLGVQVHLAQVFWQAQDHWILGQAEKPSPPSNTHATCTSGLSHLANAD